MQEKMSQDCLLLYSSFHKWLKSSGWAKLGTAAHSQESAILCSRKVNILYVFSRQIEIAHQRNGLLLKIKALVSVREQSAKVNRSMLKVTRVALITWIDWQPGDDKKLLRAGAKVWSKAISFTRYTAVWETTFQIAKRKDVPKTLSFFSHLYELV